MKSLLEILRTDDGAVASLPASPGEFDPDATVTLTLERFAVDRIVKSWGRTVSYWMVDADEWCELEDALKASLAEPAAGGTSSLKDLATRNALIRVLEEVGRCDCRDTSVKQHNVFIEEIAEKAYYETVGRGGEDDGGGALADARAASAQEDAR